MTDRDDPGSPHSPRRAGSQVGISIDSQQMLATIRA